MKKILFLALFSLTLIIRPNDYIAYHPLMSHAKLAYLKDDYKQCIKLCLDAFKKADPFVAQFRNDSYLLAKAYYKIDDNKNFRKYFETAQKNGLDPKMINKDSILFKNNYQKFYNECVITFETFCKNNDHKLIEKVQEAIRKDQKYRPQLDFKVTDTAWLAPFDTISQIAYLDYYLKVMREAPKASKVALDSLSRLQTQIDKENIEFIKSYIESNGYPSYKQLGSSQGLFGFMILHFSSAFKKTLDKLWLNQVKSGAMDPFNLAQLVDDAYMDLGEQPVYGIPKQKFTVSKNKSEKIVYDEIKVDSLRATIGLCTLSIENQILELEKKAMANE